MTPTEHAAALLDVVIGTYPYHLECAVSSHKTIMDATGGVVTKRRLVRAREALRDYRTLKCGQTLISVVAYSLYLSTGQPEDSSVARAAEQICIDIADALGLVDKIILEECARRIG